MTTWRCPVCRSPLTEDDGARAWRCVEGHSFDVAREGYVNLLITHQRRQRAPGDSADMVASRRAFLDAGWYEPLHAALQRRRPPPDHAVLDAGCGEGYYTRGWPNLWAVDIAKPAIRLAARRALPGSRYAVASVYDLPLPDASVDLIVSVFAPLPAAEFERVLRPGGRVLTVTPGPAHLAGLAAELFAEVEAHPDTGPFERDGASTTLEPDGSERVRFELELGDPAAIGALLGMTPYAWYVDEATRQRVRGLSALTTPIDFLISAYRHQIPV